MLLGIRSVPSRTVCRNFCAGSTLPRMMPFMSGTRHSTSPMPRSLIHASKSDMTRYSAPGWAHRLMRCFGSGFPGTADRARRAIGANAGRAPCDHRFMMSAAVAEVKSHSTCVAAQMSTTPGPWTTGLEYVRTGLQGLTAPFLPQLSARIRMYTAPLKDLRFVLAELIGDATLAEWPDFAEYSAELRDSVLEEAGKFAATVLDPLYRVGDIDGAQWTPDGVRMPPG